jgi:hypothetical protein
MSSRPEFDDDASDTFEEPGPLEAFVANALTILWPAFVASGVLELIVFAFVDPDQLTGWGGAPLAASRGAIYTLAFFMFWGVTAAASAVTTWLIETREG